MHSIPNRSQLHSWKFRYVVALVIFILMLTASCRPEVSDGRTKITLWMMWTRAEGEAMRQIVRDFNQSQDRIYVEVIHVSQMERKLLLATAGGNPPDIGHLNYYYIAPYAENNAITPLDGFCKKKGITREQFIPVFWDICTHRDKLWALPNLASVTALHYNKKMFREAGLDPEKPPGSMAELKVYEEKLTRYRGDGTLEQVGHMPNEPDWWQVYWFYWFGGEIWDNHSKITLDTPENLKCLEWLASYPERFGRDNLLRMKNGFGNFASPQNAFFQNRVAMVNQGIWMDNFIKEYAPDDFEYGVAPFPTSDPQSIPVMSIAEPDILFIPAGARHPEEAFEFLAYLAQQKPLEKLATLQHKMTALKNVSPEFIENHPHPYIEEFIKIAASPSIKSRVKMVSRSQLSRDLTNLVGLVLRQRGEARELIRQSEEAQQTILDRNLARWHRVEEQRLKEWNAACN